MWDVLPDTTCCTRNEEQHKALDMSFRSDNAARQTEFRLAALANGYTPLPNHDKRCFVKGWDRLEPKVADIHAWQRKLVYQATGLRVEGGLCAIDVDVNDADMVAEIWSAAVGEFPQLREALVRTGAGAKELWLCRTDEHFSRIASTAHVPPHRDPEDPEETSHRLEAFAGGHPRQIGAYGAHTMREDGTGFAVEYTWIDDESPAEVQLDALPFIPKAGILRIAEIVSGLMDDRGWPRVRGLKSGENTTATVYDLLPSMRFDCLDGVTRTLSQLADYASTDNNARCSASWLGDPQARNRTRCLVGVGHDGVVSVLETANWERHMPADQADREKPTGERANALSDKLREHGYAFDFETYHDAPVSFQDKVLELLEKWAWCGSHNTPCLPVYRDEALGMSLQNLRVSNIQYAYEREGPRGGLTKISPVDAWVSSIQREDVDGYRFMPDRPSGIYQARGENVRAINSYHPVVHEDVPEDVAAGHVRLWEDFMEHLLPRSDEREWFLDWLAHKKQNLTTPGVAVVMYASVFGVGRGSLFEIIGSVFGDEYVSNVSSDALLGIGSQSQYTDWMARALFVTTDEILPEGDDGSAMTWRRKKAYEKLKERIDPKPRRMNIVRKTLPNYNDWVYATFLLATNHDNAIPVPKGDRRLSVLTNRSTPLIDNLPLYNRLNAVRNPEMDPTFAASVARWLDRRDVSEFNAHLAPEFQGKVKMQEANVNEIESVVDSVLEQLPHDWAPLNVVLDRVSNALVRADIRDDFPGWRRVATDRVCAQWYRYKRAYITEDRGARPTILVREEENAHDVFDALSYDERRAQLADLKRFDTVASARLRALRIGMSEA